MKNTHKFLTGIIALCAATVPFAACGGEANTPAKSDYFGTFTYQETVGAKAWTLLVTNDASKLDGRKYLYTSTFPLQGIGDQPIAYNMDQRLKLNKDYTYSYDYTVQLSNPQDWGGQVARLAVSVIGTFEYRLSASGDCSVLLSNPVSGTRTVVAPNIANSSVYNWNIHDNADMTVDYAAMSTVEGFEYDKFVSSRIVVVNKAEKKLSDDIFFNDILEYIIPYCTY